MKTNNPPSAYPPFVPPQRSLLLSHLLYTFVIYVPVSKYHVCMATSQFFNLCIFPFTSHYGRHIFILLFKLLQPPTLWFWLDKYAVFTCYDCVKAPTAATSSKSWLLSSPTQVFVFPGVIINNCLLLLLLILFQLFSGWFFFVFN